jgi:hypothetical protein
MMKLFTAFSSYKGANEQWTYKVTDPKRSIRIAHLLEQVFPEKSNVSFSLANPLLALTFVKNQKCIPTKGHTSDDFIELSKHLLMPWLHIVVLGLQRSQGRVT